MKPGNEFSGWKSLICISLFLAAGCQQTIEEQVSDLNFGSKADQENSIVVYYFHATERCETCLAMEDFTKTAVQTYSRPNQMKIALEAVNIDFAENQKFVKIYGLYGSAVILTVQAEEPSAPWVNCEDIWDYYDNEEGYISYIHSQLDQYTTSLKSRKLITADQ